MRGDPDKVQVFPVVREGDEEQDYERISSSITSFDAESCRCTQQDDKDRLCAVIRTAFGGLSYFNRAIRKQMSDAGLSADDLSSESSQPDLCGLDAV